MIPSQELAGHRFEFFAINTKLKMSFVNVDIKGFFRQQKIISSKIQSNGTYFMNVMLNCIDIAFMSEDLGTVCSHALLNLAKSSRKFRKSSGAQLVSSKIP